MLIVGGVLFVVAGAVLTPAHPKVAWRGNLIALGLLAVLVVIPLVTLIKNG
jgi:hypothetical protein